MQRNDISYNHKYNSHTYREYTFYSKLYVHYCSIGYTSVKNEQQKCVDWNYVICLTSGTSTAAGCSQANGSASLVFVKVKPCCLSCLAIFDNQVDHFKIIKGLT